MFADEGVDEENLDDKKWYRRSLRSELRRRLGWRSKKEDFQGRAYAQQMVYTSGPPVAPTEGHSHRTYPRRRITLQMND